MGWAGKRARKLHADVHLLCLLAACRSSAAGDEGGEITRRLRWRVEDAVRYHHNSQPMLDAEREPRTTSQRMESRLATVLPQGKNNNGGAPGCTTLSMFSAYSIISAIVS